MKRKLSIQDLLEKPTRFPTVVIPFGRDGSNNHSFGVVDGLIFDSTLSIPVRVRARASARPSLPLHVELHFTSQEPTVTSTIQTPNRDRLFSSLS
jgi:hypothetical protein